MEGMFPLAVGDGSFGREWGTSKLGRVRPNFPHVTIIVIHCHPFHQPFSVANQFVLYFKLFSHHFGAFPGAQFVPTP